MKRREFLSAMAGLTVVGAMPAPAQPRVYRLATLTAGAPIAATSPRGTILLNGLVQRGYELGKNLSYDSRGSVGKNELLPQLVQELKAQGTEVLVTVGFPAAIAAKNSGVATVLASGSGDPVATGLVQSLARPGGSITGIADDAATLSTKRLSLLVQALPRLRRVAMLWNTDDLGMSLRYTAAAKAAQAMGVEVQALGVREPDDFKEAFQAMSREMPDAILMVSDSLTILNRKRVIDFATDQKLPAIYEADSIVRDGGLMSYGTDDRESFDRAAAMVQQVFRGAKPSDIPVEQPTRFLFVINLKAAKAIGLELPPTVTALADDIVE